MVDRLPLEHRYYSAELQAEIQGFLDEKWSEGYSFPVILDALKEKFGGEESSSPEKASTAKTPEKEDAPDDLVTAAEAKQEQTSAEDIERVGAAKKARAVSEAAETKKHSDADKDSQDAATNAVPVKTSK